MGMLFTFCAKRYYIIDHNVHKENSIFCYLDSLTLYD